MAVKLPQSLKDNLERAAERYAKDIDLAAPYLETRGIDKTTAEKYMLGYVKEPAVGHDSYVNMLSIAYLTPTGVVGMKFRHIGEDTRPKYLGLEGMESRIYNVTALHNSTDEIAVCEGELDTIILDGVVGIPAVGVAGVQHWKKHHPRVFEGYSRILIFADNDVKESGENPGFELAKRIIRDLPQAVRIALPRGMDVNSAYLEHGADFLRGLVNERD